MQIVQERVTDLSVSNELSEAGLNVQSAIHFKICSHVNCNSNMRHTGVNS